MKVKKNGFVVGVSMLLVLASCGGGTCQVEEF